MPIGKTWEDCLIWKVIFVIKGNTFEDIIDVQYAYFVKSEEKPASTWK